MIYNNLYQFLIVFFDGTAGKAIDLNAIGVAFGFVKSSDSDHFFVTKTWVFNSKCTSRKMSATIKCSDKW